MMALHDHTLITSGAQLRFLMRGRKHFTRLNSPPRPDAKSQLLLKQTILLKCNAVVKNVNEAASRLYEPTWPTENVNAFGVASCAYRFESTGILSKLIPN